MSWLSRTLGFVGLGADRLSNLDRGQQVSGAYTRRTDADITVSDERAMSVAAAWACARIIVQSGATLPLTFYRDGANGSREDLPENDPLVRMLNGSPNKYMNAQEFRQAMWTQRVLWGNAYASIKYDGAGRVASMIPLKSEHVIVERQDNGILYRYSNDRAEDEFFNGSGRPQVLHWKGWGPDGVIGLSPLAYARHSMGVAVSADRKASKSFAGRPNGVLSTDQVLKPDQREQIRDIYGKVGDSATGDGQWWLLEGGFKYQAIGLPPDDLQMLESRQFQVAEICRFFGVPVVMIEGGDKGAAWPASYEQQVLAFKTFTLSPYFEEFEQKIAEVFGQGRKVEHDTTNLVRPDSQAMAQYLATAVQNGLMTRNEARKMMKLKAIDGADELTVQLNLTELDELQAATGETPDVE